MAPDPISLAAASPRSKLRDPTSTVIAVRHEFLCDLKSDSLISPGDQGDALVVHDVLLYIVRLEALAIWSSWAMVPGGSSSVAAARFSRRWPIDDVPGMRSIFGAR